MFYALSRTILRKTVHFTAEPFKRRGTDAAPTTSGGAYNSPRGRQTRMWQGTAKGAGANNIPRRRGAGGATPAPIAQNSATGAGGAPQGAETADGGRTRAPNAASREAAA